MRLLLDGGASVTATSNGGLTPLMFVQRLGSIEAAKLLLDRGSDINAQPKGLTEDRRHPATMFGATVLLRAVVRGHVDLAIFLMDHGADPNLMGIGYAPLHWASGIWDSPISTEYKFEEGEWSGIHGIPSRDDKVRMIKSLVAHGADINARTKIEPVRAGATLLVLITPGLRTGQTPFYIAAQSGDAATMKLLLSLGADPSIRSTNNTTPLMAAAGRVRIDYESSVHEDQAFEALKVAQEAGNDLQAANTEGETALHCAAMAGFNKIVEYLIAAGLSPSQKTTKGKTPLMLAQDGTGYSNMLAMPRPKTAELLANLAQK
jgi:ankyrin repeat protein